MRRTTITALLLAGAWNWVAAADGGMPSASGMAFSENLLDWMKAAFPIIRGHEAEVIASAPGRWLRHYGPDGCLDMPGCDIGVAVYDGRIESPKDRPDLAGGETGAAAVTLAGGFHLGTRRNEETGKASFSLNGRPFYPFVYYENYRAVTAANNATAATNPVPK